ncbi:MAG TPA: hypothetical protein VFO29_00070 [Candidatus Rubrimentiphilum sp.]|nr:hypothetical protein [Candidatus Rubrimentiphilum sp.]
MKLAVFPLAVLLCAGAITPVRAAEDIRVYNAQSYVISVRIVYRIGVTQDKNWLYGHETAEFPGEKSGSRAQRIAANATVHVHGKPGFWPCSLEISKPGNYEVIRAGDYCKIRRR